MPGSEIPSADQLYFEWLYIDQTVDSDNVKNFENESSARTGEMVLGFERE